MPRRPTDLSAAEFKARLKHLGFAYIPQAKAYVDLTRKGGPRIEIDPPPSRRFHRTETIGHLLTIRARRKAADAVRDALEAEQACIAAAIAPVALPPPRDGLSGAEAIARLADDFLTAATRADGVTLPDLMRIGWRKAQVLEYADAARTLAYSRQGGAFA